MRKKTTITLLFCLVIFSYSLGLAAVNVTPSSISVAQGQAGTITLQYQFTNVLDLVGSPLTGVITSTNGTFLTTDAVLGTNPVPMPVNITGGRGMASEVLVVPVGVIERALRNGTKNFWYRRIFASAAGETAMVQMSITSESAASFNIKRIELYFDNRRAEVTVPKYFPKLKAYADIRYTGSGLLEGYWEVDGRIVSRVHQMLTFGAMITLPTPDVPDLPTFAPGTHILRFVTTNQAAGLPTPALIYFVTTEEYMAKKMELAVKAPQDGSAIERSAALFQWGSFKGASLFLIQYYEDVESKPVFSAYTKKTSYVLPKQVFTNIFSSGKKYYWKVTGYNEKDNITGESAVKSFMIK